MEAYAAEPVEGEHAFDIMMSDDVDKDDPDCMTLVFTQKLLQDSIATPLNRDFRLAHTFDSSEYAYEELSYLQFMSSDGVIHILGIDQEFMPIESFGFGDGALPPGASFTITSTGQEDVEAQQTFEFGDEDFATVHEAGTFTVDESTGCSSWTSADGMMGGGGC